MQAYDFWLPATMVAKSAVVTGLSLSSLIRCLW